MLSEEAHIVYLKWANFWPSFSKQTLEQHDGVEDGSPHRWLMVSFCDIQSALPSFARDQNSTEEVGISHVRFTEDSQIKRVLYRSKEHSFISLRYDNMIILQKPKTMQALFGLAFTTRRQIPRTICLKRKNDVTNFRAAANMFLMSFGSRHQRKGRDFLRMRCCVEICASKKWYWLTTNVQGQGSRVLANVAAL
ncbi:hypothetical protein RRG08_025587 [Elysia crispata]|uniref:Uncharacterized protein n=1 Tax=Elysia crispata TaxID=231223 RepID=A0AAE0YFT7_9GAST|nr:hypothetical protein RRG08_025587 [Elysia crispata]